MKQNGLLKIILGIAGLLLLFVLYKSVIRPIVVNVKPSADTSSFGASYELKTVSNCTATTSPAYVASGGTTTLNLPGGDGVMTTNIFVISSTTPPNFTYHYETSEDGIDWYTIARPTTPANDDYATSTPVVLNTSYLTISASSTLGSSYSFATGVATGTVWYVQVPKITVQGTYSRLKVVSIPATNLCISSIIKTELR